MSELFLYLRDVLLNCDYRRKSHLRYHVDQRGVTQVKGG